MRPAGGVARGSASRDPLVAEDFAGDPRRSLGDAKEARKALKRFPTIGDPGVDEILLFCADIPVAAVPSNCPHVPLRLGVGVERPSYAASYRSIQAELTRLLSGDAAAMKRAHLPFRRHGKELGRRTVPLCDRCPVAAMCQYHRSRDEKKHSRDMPISRAEVPICAQ